MVAMVVSLFGGTASGTNTVNAICTVSIKGISRVQPCSQLRAVTQKLFTGTNVLTNLTVMLARAVPLFGGTASCLKVKMFGTKVLMSLTVKVVPLFGGTASSVAMIVCTRTIVTLGIKTVLLNGGHP